LYGNGSFHDPPKRLYDFWVFHDWRKNHRYSAALFEGGLAIHDQKGVFQSAAWDDIEGMQVVKVTCKISQGMHQPPGLTLPCPMPLWIAGVVMSFVGFVLCQKHESAAR
jgi:hypothetical protein